MKNLRQPVKADGRGRKGERHGEGQSLMINMLKNYRLVPHLNTNSFIGLLLILCQVGLMYFEERADWVSANFTYPWFEERKKCLIAQHQISQWLSKRILNALCYLWDISHSPCACTSLQFELHFFIFRSSKRLFISLFSLFFLCSIFDQSKW